MSRHRFDHAAARAYFVSLDPGERSSAAVAQKFGVSKRTIEKWRALDDWNEAAAKADRAAAAALDRQAVKTREQRALQDARIRDSAANRVQRRLGDDDVSDDWVARVLQDADRRVRLNEGEATDHVAVATVQAGFREALAAPSELLGLLLERGLSGRRLVEAFRAELPPMLGERLALLDRGGDAADGLA